MPRRSHSLDAPFQSIAGASRVTGLSQGYIRAGCKAGAIPHVRVGSEYRINVPLLLEALEAASMANVREGRK